MKSKPLPSRLRLNELFIYDNGKLIRRVSVGARGRAGDEAGTVHHKGYRQVRVDKELYFTHRLVYKLIHGEDPVDIDHINGDTLDNRITNLRSVEHADNMRNAKLQGNNTSGVLGVGYRKKSSKWAARLGDVWIGEYPTFEEAVAARRQAEIDHDYHENHGRVV